MYLGLPAMTAREIEKMQNVVMHKQYRQWSSAKIKIKKYFERSEMSRINYSIDANRQCLIS